MKHPKLQKIAGVVISISMFTATSLAGDIIINKAAASGSLWNSFCSFFGF